MTSIVGPIIVGPDTSFRTDLRRLLCWALPDSLFLRLLHFWRTGQPLNLRNPRTFNEKLQWLKLNYRPGHVVQLVDKLEVREFISRRIGDSYLIPIHDVFNSVEELRKATPPDSFVLKPTHASGWIVLCRDEESLNWPTVYSCVARWLNRNYYYYEAEWPYRFVTPRVVCEQMMLDQDGLIPIDYKVFVMNGTPVCIQVDHGRFGHHTRDFYDVDWNRLPMELNYSRSAGGQQRPRNLEEMLAVARALAKDMPFCRIDLYDLESAVMFGEITLFPEAGAGNFRPPSYDAILGRMLTLPTPQQFGD